MARIGHFVYCVNAERVGANQAEAINAMSVMSVLTPEFIPGLFSFSIVFSLMDVDTENNNLIKIIFKDTDNKEIVNTGNVVIQPAPKSDDIPQEYRGFNLSMDFRNVILEFEGVYTTEIYFNDEFISSQPIYAKGKR